ncbi:response regulator [Parabacteroides pacaensis]|uniref:response regulator n=1 Tax=Parabacteroides pacaensis TaxID=2086575 RepID=UPI000D0EC88A|nr:response regulator [Parabacteroides pacaensis]
MNKTVLLVDDKLEFAKIVRLYLFKYDVRYAENPVKAIEWLEEGNYPDLIISDLNMPEMSGEEFLHYLKTNKLYKSIPVIILSSIEDRMNRVKLFDEGASDFLLKPFDPEEICSKIEQIIN